MNNTFSLYYDPALRENSGVVLPLKFAIKLRFENY